jgi:hypothetical protein
MGVVDLLERRTQARGEAGTGFEEAHGVEFVRLR